MSGNDPTRGGLTPQASSEGPGEALDFLRNHDLILAQNKLDAAQDHLTKLREKVARLKDTVKGLEREERENGGVDHVFKKLPLELSQKAMEFLDDKSLLSMTQVSRGAKEVTNIVLNARHLKGRVALYPLSADDVVNVAAAGRLKGATSLDLTECWDLTDDDVASLCNEAPQITELVLNHCESLTENILAVITEKCPNVTRIHLEKNNSAISDATLLGLQPEPATKEEEEEEPATKEEEEEEPATKEEEEEEPATKEATLARRLKLEMEARRLEPGLKAQRLVCVNLAGCRHITDAGVATLVKGCTNLEEVNLSSARGVADAAVRMLATLGQTLLRVNLACTSITDEGVQYLAENCRKLKSADFSDTAITDVAIAALAGASGPEDGEPWAFAGHGCPDLEALDINDCDNMTTTAIIMLAGPMDKQRRHLQIGCPNLTSLHFAECRRVRTEAAVALAGPKAWNMVTDNPLLNEFPPCRGCLRLQSVTLPHNVNSDGFAALAQCCPIKKIGYDPMPHGSARARPLDETALDVLARHGQNVREVRIGCSERISSRSLQGLAEGCPNLRVVYLKNGAKLRNFSILALANMCKGLEELSVTKNEHITDEAVVALATNCRGLRVVNFSNCRLLTDAAVEALATECRHLRIVDLFNCPKLTHMALRSLADAVERYNLPLTNVNFVDVTQRNVPAAVWNGAEGHFSSSSREMDVEVKRLAKACKTPYWELSWGRMFEFERGWPYSRELERGTPHMVRFSPMNNGSATLDGHGPFINSTPELGDLDRSDQLVQRLLRLQQKQGRSEGGGGPSSSGRGGGGGGEEGYFGGGAIGGGREGSKGGQTFEGGGAKAEPTFAHTTL